MTITEEAVEAAAQADHAHGRLAHDPDWAGPRSALIEIREDPDV